MKKLIIIAILVILTGCGTESMPEVQDCIDSYKEEFPGEDFFVGDKLMVLFPENTEYDKALKILARHGIEDGIDDSLYEDTQTLFIDITKENAIRLRCILGHDEDIQRVVLDIWPSKEAAIAA
ncbi:MAG: hypothetical protein KKE20_04635, partial [Nanoarchaeota archaeon]|nr:hypothetical protein [Nanoarchaeota archaeon]